MNAWVRTVTVLGATATIACYRVYWLTTDFERRMERVERNQQLIIAFEYANCLTLANGDESARSRCAIAFDGGLAALK